MLTIKSPEPAPVEATVEAPVDATKAPAEQAPIVESAEAAVESAAPEASIEAPAVEAPAEKEKPQTTAKAIKPPKAKEKSEKENVVSEKKQENDSLSELSKFIQKHSHLSSDDAIKKYTSVKSLNPESLSEMDAILRTESIRNPELSIEELQLIIDDKYKLDPDEYTEREIALGKALLKRDAATAKADLIKYKNSLLSNDGVEKNSEQENGAEPITSNKPSETEIARWKSDVSSIAKDMQPIEFEGLDFKYQIPDEQLLEYAEEVSNLPLEVLSQYQNENGEIDVVNAIAERAIIDNINDIIKYAVEFDRSKRELDVVTKTKNPSFPSVANPQTQTKGSVDPVVAHMQSQFKSSGRGMVIK